MSFAIKHLPSPDGRYLASVCGSRIALWEEAIEEPVCVVSGCSDATIELIAWTPGGEVLVASTQDGGVQAWAVPGGTLVVSWSPLPGSPSIKAISCSPRGTYIAALTEKQSIQIWDVSDGQLVAHFGVPFSADSLIWSDDERMLSTNIAPVCWWDCGVVQLFSLPDQSVCLEASAPHRAVSEDEDLLAMLTALSECEQTPDSVRSFVGQFLHSPAPAA